MPKKIFFTVLFSHLAVVLMLFFSSPSRHLTPPKKIAVRTHTMAIKSPPVQKQAIPTAPSRKKTPKKTPPKEPKKSPAKKPAPQVTPTKTAKKDPPPEKKTVPTPSPTVALEEPLPLSIPKPLAPLEIDLNPEIKLLGAPSYQETLIGYLHTKLRLPEFGEVKLEIVLTPEGKVKSVRVLQSASILNKNYLEKNLPLLKFPPPTVLDSSKKEQTYILVFCNEI